MRAQSHSFSHNFCMALSQRVWPGLLGTAFVSCREPAEGAHWQLNVVFLCLCLNNELFGCLFAVVLFWFSAFLSVTNACDSLSYQIAGSLGAKAMENDRLHIHPTQNDSGHKLLPSGLSSTSPSTSISPICDILPVNSSVATQPLL